MGEFMCIVSIPADGMETVDELQMAETACVNRFHQSLPLAAQQPSPFHV